MLSEAFRASSGLSSATHNAAPPRMISPPVLPTGARRAVVPVAAAAPPLRGTPGTPPRMQGHDGSPAHGSDGSLYEGPSEPILRGIKVVPADEVNAASCGGGSAVDPPDSPAVMPLKRGRDVGSASDDESDYEASGGPSLKSMKLEVTTALDVKGPPGDGASAQEPFVVTTPSQELSACHALRSMRSTEALSAAVPSLDHGLEGAQSMMDVTAE